MVFEEGQYGGREAGRCECEQEQEPADAEEQLYFCWTEVAVLDRTFVIADDIVESYGGSEGGDTDHGCEKTAEPCCHAFRRVASHGGDVAERMAMLGRDGQGRAWRIGGGRLICTTQSQQDKELVERKADLELQHSRLSLLAQVASLQELALRR